MGGCGWVGAFAYVSCHRCASGSSHASQPVPVLELVPISCLPAACLWLCRAHVEVRRALHQNSMCRAPLLSTLHSKAELAELYRLHLQQSEVPADFGTLLQLR